MVKLFCALVAAPGSAFLVEIDASESVSGLKEAIKAKKPRKITCDADELELYVAKKGGAWLSTVNNREINEDMKKMVDGEHLNPTITLQQALLDTMPDPSTGQIHVVVVVPPEEVVAVPGGKRQRTADVPIYNPSELTKLTVSAQKLRVAEVGTVLEMPDKVFGTNLHNGLYIRQEYWDLHKIITQRLASDQSIHRVLVVGSPGIGKSVFGVFLLLLFMAEKRDLAYRPLADPLMYFSWNSTQNEYEVSDTPLAGRTYDGLFDGNESGGALRFDSLQHAFLFASPRTTNYNEFVKETCFMVYMNPWTKVECHSLADAIKFDQDEWVRRFNLVGGKPRFVFSSNQTFDDLVQHVQQAIPHIVDALKDQVRLFEQKVFDDRMKHIVFHLYRNENAPSRAYIAYSSLAVEAIMNARYEIRSADQIRLLLQTPAPNLQAWRGLEIEKFLLQDLATSKFCAKALEGRNVGTVTQYGPLHAASEIVQETAKIQKELKLYIPLSKTFPALDGVLVVPEARRIIYAQSTVATGHPIKYQPLKEIYQQLSQKRKFRGYTHMLLFIVSDDIYDGFTVQRYKNGDGTNRTTKIDINVTQYVGKIIRQ